MTLRYHQLSLRRRGHTLLQPCSGALFCGQLTAVVGPNGAGKSSFLHLLSGALPPSGGSVELDGQPLAAWDRHELARRRALLAQSPDGALDRTVRELITLGRYPHRHQPSARETHIVDDAAACAGLAGMLERPLHGLSGGERARAHFARVLAQIWEAPADGGSRWLFLDEPTAALDLRHQKEVLQCAHDWAVQQRIGVVAVVHDLNLALRYAHRVLVLHQGRCVADGEPAPTLHPDRIGSIWQVEATSIRLPPDQPRILWI